MRAHRCIQDGYVYHLTARCSDREFLLKFKRWRDEYRRRLREALALFDVWLLTYCVTGNHIHLVVTAASLDELAAFMDKVQGEFAQCYNRCRNRSGHFWGEPRWTEAIAVGDEEYVRDIADRVRGRASLLLAEADDGVWFVRDSAGDVDGDGLDGAVLLRCDSEGAGIDPKESGRRIGAYW